MNAENERIKTFNMKLTNLILNMDNSQIVNGLNYKHCNKEITILEKKINKEFNKDDIKCLLQKIDINDINALSKYYVRIKHIFASLFNIIGTNYNIQESKLIVPFDISNCVPNIIYIYKSKYDHKTQSFILDRNDYEIFNKDLIYFCSFFYNKKKKSEYCEININCVRKHPLCHDKKIFESYFKNYTYYFTLLTQTIKNIHNELLSIINKYFNFDSVDNVCYIRNILNMDELDKLTMDMRNIIIQYFFSIEEIYQKTEHFFRLYVMDMFSKTMEKRMNTIH